MDSVFQGLNNLNSLASRMTQGDANLSKSLERLSSGVRISSASDDAAALAMSGRTDTDSKLYTQAVANINDGISMVNLASEALDAMSTLVTQLQELSGRATSSMLTATQREALNKQAQTLKTEYERIRTSTSYNERDLIPSTETSIQIQSGIKANSTSSISIGGSESNATFLATVTENIYTGELSADATFGTGITSQRDNTVADMNGDGILDVVSVGGDGGAMAVRVRLGNGDGTLRAAAAYTMTVSGGTEYAYSNVVGDFDGDTYNDVVAVSWESTATFSRVHFFKGNSNGTLRADVKSAATGIPSTLSKGDFDKDGDLDILYGDGLTYEVRLATNNGSGSFTAGTLVAGGRGAGDPSVGDVNNDGNLDFVGGSNTGTISVLLGNGNATFQAAINLTGSGFTSSTALGDVNGDGRLDIVATNGAANSFGLFLGNGNGTYSARTDIATGATTARKIALADLTGDGILDMTVAGSYGANTPMATLVGNGNGTFGAPFSLTTTANVHALASGDFDGDGNTDIVAQGYNGGVRIFLTAPTALTTTSAFSLTTVERATGALAYFESLQKSLSIEQGRTSASKSRLDASLSNAEAMRSTLDSATSKIRDIDAAEELSKYIAQKVQLSINSALMAHAASDPGQLMSLLMGA